MTVGSAFQHIEKRRPEVVMRLKRLGVLHQSRLSFMRVLLRRMAAERWRMSRPVFSIDAHGVGHAVYSVDTGRRIYSLVAFSHDLPDQIRSDRVIAEAWDATFALFDGSPGRADIERMAGNVPKQEAGRITERELTLSRANRSVRLWNHVLSALRAGRQPDAAEIDRVGYLMRTTAVYGSGKFGAADRNVIADRPEMNGPFQAEMLTVYLIRVFVRDLIDHLAQESGGVRLDPALSRRLGIGNSTGLGMAPFLINHPGLLNNWIAAREEAIFRVRCLEQASADEIALFRQMVRQAALGVEAWRSEHPVQRERLDRLRHDMRLLIEKAATHDFGGLFPWDRFFRWAEDRLCEDAQELTASLMLEPYGQLVDELADSMSDDGPWVPRINGAQSVSDLRGLIEQHYGWALKLDWEDRACCARAWYTSEEKQEPRLGERFEESVAPYEQPLAPARDITALFADLQEWRDDAPIADVLLRHPEHRHAIRRVQTAADLPFAEIRDNTIGADLLPIDMLRAKLSFFGATQFDPRSDRWVRVSMYAGAPYPETLTPGTAEFWVYPETVQ